MHPSIDHVEYAHRLTNQPPTTESNIMYYIESDSTDFIGTDEILEIIESL